MTRFLGLAFYTDKLPNVTVFQQHLSNRLIYIYKLGGRTPNLFDHKYKNLSFPRCKINWRRTVKSYNHHNIVQAKKQFSWRSYLIYLWQRDNYQDGLTLISKQLTWLQYQRFLWAMSYLIKETAFLGSTAGRTSTTICTLQLVRCQE